MHDVARALGAHLARPGVVERLRPLRAVLAAAEVGEPAAHVDRVLERVETMIDRAYDARILKLAALAHELGPARVAPALGCLGVEPATASLAARIVASFWAADLWRGADDAGPVVWFRRAGTRASLLLLFEIAHEGAVTAGMTAAARIAGLGAEVDSWRARLAARRE